MHVYVCVHVCAFMYAICACMYESVCMPVYVCACTCLYVFALLSA